jgi:hypothetical protein
VRCAHASGKSDKARSKRRAHHITHDQNQRAHFGLAAGALERIARHADLLIVDGDPISDVRELRKLKTVYRGGVAYDPKALLAQVPQRHIKYAA